MTTPDWMSFAAAMGWVLVETAFKLAVVIPWLVRKLNASMSTVRGYRADMGVPARNGVIAYVYAINYLVTLLLSLLVIACCVFVGYAALLPGMKDIASFSLLIILILDILWCVLDVYKGIPLKEAVLFQMDST
ncbi:MAG: hypothetical protein KAV87_30025 [Desulfobacteraceae bacterium]|nr:hypothetical protein [Desulfobacteraceae bacterium]